MTTRLRTVVTAAVTAAAAAVLGTGIAFPSAVAPQAGASPAAFATVNVPPDRGTCRTHARSSPPGAWAQCAYARYRVVVVCRDGFSGTYSTHYGDWVRGLDRSGFPVFSESTAYCSQRQSLTFPYRVQKS